MRFNVPPKYAPRALGMVQLYNGTSAWRIIWPMDYLKKVGYEVTWGFNQDKQTSTALADADVVIMHRLAWAPGDEGKAIAWRNMLHDSGKALIYDHDDDLITPDIISRVQKTLPPNSKQTPERIDLERRAHLFCISLCDGVICSTPNLAEKTRPLTDKAIIVVPNAIDLHRFSLVTSLESVVTDRPVTIGWVGGNRPDSDADDLATAWARIARLYPSVRFVVAGHPMPVLLNSVPPGQIHYLPPKPLDAYQRSYVNIDIGCCPLADEPFNRSKSPIKAWEYATAGAAVVASPTVYSSVIRHGENGLICDSAAEWIEALSALIEREDYRRHLQQNMFRRVEAEWSLEVNAHHWPEAWSSIMGDFCVRSVVGSAWGPPTPRSHATSYDVPVAPVAE